MACSRLRFGYPGAVWYNAPMYRSAKPILLAAKFFRPALPPQQVARTQLVVRLEAGLQAAHSLTLISAPAGYGKSTLASEWEAQVERPAA